MTDDVLLSETNDGVAVLTLNRPEKRNALNSALTRALRDAMRAADADDAVSVIVLTGADPVFCAGVDLKDIGGGASDRFTPGTDTEPGRPWARTTKPVIGAINGAAVTGGFELALQCDFLVASERAAFGDTHARVGLLPGWGLSVLLPQAIGVRRAREMSLTGNFVLAEEALRLGLVNHVVPHESLLEETRRIALDIAGNDQRAVRALLAEYDETTSTTVHEALRIESRKANQWNADPATVAAIAERRQGIIERGRTQV